MNDILLNCIIMNDLDKPNLNNRVYTKALAEKMVSDCIDKEILGTLDITARELELNEISHVVTNLSIKDDKVYGDIKVLDTPNGKFLREMINEKHPISFGVCGTGNTHNQDDGSVLVTDFNLKSINVNIS